MQRTDRELPTIEGPETVSFPPVIAPVRALTQAPVLIELWALNSDPVIIPEHTEIAPTPWSDPQNETEEETFTSFLRLKLPPKLVVLTTESVPSVLRKQKVETPPPKCTAEPMDTSLATTAGLEKDAHEPP